MADEKKLDTELETAPDLVALEHEVLAYWEERRCFDQRREKNARGQIAGMKRNHVLQNAIQEEKQIRATHSEALDPLERVLESARTLSSMACRSCR